MASTPPPSRKFNLSQIRNSRARRILIFALFVFLFALISVGLTERSGGLRAWLAGSSPPAASLEAQPGGLPAPGATLTQATLDSLIFTATPAAPPLSASLTPTSTPPSADLATPTASQNPLLSFPDSGGPGFLILALAEGWHSHLYAYQPPSLPLTRLTAGEWRDIDPSASPDGARLAFASNREGHWDLYVMSLSDGALTRVTDTPEYDGAPSWSPDGRWLVYESYVIDPLNEEGNLDLFIRDISLPDPASQAPIRLTTHPGADFSPAWSPSGRQVAFISDSSGELEVWLADLDHIGDPFANLSRRSQAPDAHLAWSPDGRYLAWSASVDGVRHVLAWDAQAPQNGPQVVVPGDWPVWGAGGSQLITALYTPNRAYLSGYAFPEDSLSMAPVALDSGLLGLTWVPGRLTEPLPAAFAQAAGVTPALLWQAALSSSEDLPEGRRRVVPLSEVNAPYAFLHDEVDESFYALRSAVIAATGWDFLATLENAYVPLSMPLYPGMLDDWLYTGRAFAANPAPLNAGWMTIVREDFGAETYWRVYLRARLQDGTQGIPLRQLPWDLHARSRGDPRSYEQGGSLLERIPGGYWVDFTQLAAQYGWERLPALSSWRIAYATARFTEFVSPQGLSWQPAMLQLYPPEAVATVTPLPPPSDTPTITPIPSRTPTATQTLRPSLTPTATPNPPG